MIETYYRILKHDKEGKLVKDSGLMPSRSYVIQFLELVSGFLKQAYDGNIDTTATDVDGAESTLLDVSDEITDYGRMNAGIGADTYGIVIGINTGATAEGNEDYALDTKILHSGTGEADKMSYQAVVFVAPTANGGNVDFDISRPYLNETGNTITVKEIGLICRNIADTKYHLLLRDVVSDEDVLDGYTLTVVYTLRTTV